MLPDAAFDMTTDELTGVGRVLMTTDTVGGVWTYALQLSGLLSARRVEVVLAAMGGEPSGAQYEEAACLSGVTLHTSRFALEWMPEPWDDVARAGEWLLELERQYAPDIVHANCFAPGSLSFAAPILVVAHSCVASWWQAVRREPLPREWRRYEETVRAGLASASRLAVPTRAMREALVRCYGVGHDAMVIPNARTVAPAPPAPKTPFVLAAGRAWDPAKNFRTLDEAAAGLPWPVRVAGETAASYGEDPLLSHVEPLGRQSAEQMAALMSSAAIFAHPARYEPFGLSVLEAALSGCALVLGDIETLRENWSGAARFVSPDDPAALRNTIRELIASPGEREALGAAARRRAALFSPTVHRDSYYALYQEMTRDARRNVPTRSAALRRPTSPRA